MPRWTLSLCSLAGRSGIQALARPQHQYHYRQWCPVRPPPWSYSTALLENRQDDASPAPIDTQTESPVDSDHEFSIPTCSSAPDIKEQTSIMTSAELADSEPGSARRHRRKILTKRRPQATNFQRPEHSTPRRTLEILMLSSGIPSRCSKNLKYVSRRKNLYKHARQHPVSAGPFEIPLSKYLPVWHGEFAKIDMYYNKTLPNHYLRRRYVPILTCQALGWVTQVMDHLDNGESITALLVKLQPEGHTDRDLVWMQVALWFLTYDPPWMIRFLWTTHVGPYPPAVCVENSLSYLAQHYTHSDDLKEASHHLRELADLFCILADRTSKERLSFMKPFIRHVIRHCTVQQVDKMFWAIKDHQVQLQWSTYLHFVTYFAKHDCFEQAVEALLEAKRAGASINREAFRSNCSTLLRKAIEQPDGLRVCLHIVSSLVDMGVILDNPICDIIMLNAIEAGDLNTAFSVYHSLVERGLQPTEATFAVLLKGCKMNIDDADMLNKTIRDAISNINVRQSPLVATGILHCLALHHSKHNPKMVYNTIADAYAQLFDVGPLQKLRLSVPNSSPKDVPARKPMTPTPHAIGFMIGASLQQALARNAKPRELFPLYERWRELVQAGDPDLAKLATTDHLANIFLMAFIRTPSGLIHAARVIRDMQRSLPPTANVAQCAPTVQTWSIFLHGFTRHGKTALAEQILTYMRGKGIEPNIVTWSTLATGYARAQDFEGTVGVLRRGEDGGAVWNAWTRSGVDGLRGGEDVWGEVGRERWRRVRLREKEREVDFTEELKTGLGERLGAEERVGGGDDRRVNERV